MTHQTKTPTPTPSTTKPWPSCGRCPRPANVVYLAKTDHPVPRCWDHAPSFPEAVALGWMEPPTGVDRRDHLV